MKKQNILGTIKNIRIKRLAWADVMIRLGQLAREKKVKLLFSGVFLF